ncbi:MAG: discoidin domain-containing protein [Bacteroidota bacterium]
MRRLARSRLLILCLLASGCAGAPPGPVVTVTPPVTLQVAGPVTPSPTAGPPPTSTVTASPLPPPTSTLPIPGTATPSLTPPVLPTFPPTESPWQAWISSHDNVALGKPVRVSQAAWGFGGRLAVDGKTRTMWKSGAGPDQWIEIDLEAAYDIDEIVLMPGQHYPGVTLHRVLGKGTGAFQVLYTFQSQLSDSPLLAQATPGPWRGIRVVRIETTFSPVPIAWREIAVIRAR